MNRRNFLKALVATSSGLLIPNTAIIVPPNAAIIVPEIRLAAPEVLFDDDLAWFGNVHEMFWKTGGEWYGCWRVYAKAKLDGTLRGQLDLSSDVFLGRTMPDDLTDQRASVAKWFRRELRRAGLHPEDLEPVPVG